jgi:predicted membrane channel-forming protein YqfA (hemolysin III family)
MTIVRNLAMSIAFPLAAATITLMLWAASAIGYHILPGHQVDSWLAQVAYTAVFALLAGVMVDTVRWLTDTAWRSAAPRAGRRSRGLRRGDACLAD